jgi:hypothetical protein
MSLSDIPPEVRKQIMEDPSVQAAVQEQAVKMGKEASEALKDPAVQKQILDTIQQKFPQYASVATAKIHEFCSDPQVQAAARKYLGMVGDYAMKAGGHLVAQIEQGPTGVRLLSFLAGCLSAGNAVMAVINPLGVFTGTVGYLLAFYQLIFAVTTALFEAPPEYIAKAPGLNQYQDMLMDKMKFLVETNGRGFFYIFQGSLWLSFASLTELLDLISGLAMVFVGILNLLIHYGGFATFQEKVKEGYEKLGKGSAQPLNP